MATILSFGYRPYLDLVAAAATETGIPAARAADLAGCWKNLSPWPETAPLLAELAPDFRLGVVTNCSEQMGQACARQVWPHFNVVLTAERAGCYKPAERIYRQAIEEMGMPAERIPYVAGSPYDVVGAANAGMPVCWHNRLGFVSEHARAVALGSFSRLDNLQSLFL